MPFSCASPFFSRSPALISSHRASTFSVAFHLHLTKYVRVAVDEFATDALKPPQSLRIPALHGQSGRASQFAAAQVPQLFTQKREYRRCPGHPGLHRPRKANRCAETYAFVCDPRGIHQAPANAQSLSWKAATDASVLTAGKYKATSTERLYEIRLFHC